MLTGATEAAPVGLGAAAAKAGFAAGGAVSGLQLVILHFMTLGKIQTGALCLLILTAPLAWQRHVQARVGRERTQAEEGFRTAAQGTHDAEAELRRIRDAIAREQSAILNAQSRLAALRQNDDQKRERPAYQWVESSSVFRVPKKLLPKVDVSAAANKRGQLTEQIKEILLLSESEVERTQRAIDRFLSDYQSAQAETVHPATPSESDLAGHNPGEVRVFEVQAVPARLRALRQPLFTELEGVLGSDRFELFRHALRNWMPIDDEDRGINSGMAVLNLDHREVFYKPKPGDRWLGWGIDAPSTHMRMSMAIDDIPAVYRAQLPDWIALALSQPEPP